MSPCYLEKQQLHTAWRTMYGLAQSPPEFSKCKNNEHTLMKTSAQPSMKRGLPLVELPKCTEEATELSHNRTKSTQVQTRYMVLHGVSSLVKSPLGGWQNSLYRVPLPNHATLRTCAEDPSCKPTENPHNPTTSDGNVDLKDLSTSAMVWSEQELCTPKMRSRHQHGKL